MNEGWIGCADLYPPHGVPSTEYSFHCPAILRFGELENSGPKPFKFVNYWINHADFLRVVGRVWQVEVDRNPIVVLHKKP